LDTPTPSAMDSPLTARKKGKVNALKSVGNFIKNSPQVVRKAFGGKPGTRLKVGKGKQFSELSGCQDNGWLVKDEDIRRGINYKIKYLGSVEVDFDPTSSTSNQEHAQKAMRALRLHQKGLKGKASKMSLTVSMKNITLRTLDGSKTILRHSTTRIAYSTVDVENAKLFGYVAMVKGSKLCLCHIFKTKTPKQGYEMTFVCAQAFDTNFRTWQAAKEKGQAPGGAEAADIEPTKAWQKKAGEAQERPSSPLVTSQTPDVSTPAAAGAASNSTPAPSKSPLATEVSTPANGVSDVELPKDADEKVFLAIMEGQDPAVLAAEYFANLNINMVEEEDNDDDLDKAFQSLAVSRAANLEVGVDTAAYNEAAKGDGNDNAGYMCIGDTSFNMDDDDDADYED